MRNPLTYVSLLGIVVGVLAVVYLPSRLLVLPVLLILGVGVMIQYIRDGQELFARLSVLLVMLLTILAGFFWRFAGDVVSFTLILFFAALLVLSRIHGATDRQKLIASRIAFIGGLLAATAFNHRGLVRLIADMVPRTIEGQAFVISANGEALKLGMVEVSAVDRVSFETALKRAIEEHEDEIEADESAVKRTLGEQKAADAVVDAATRGISGIEGGKSPEVTATEGAMLSQAAALSKVAASEYREALEAKKSTLASIVRDAFWACPSGSKIAATETDADGRFHLKMGRHREGFCVVAVVTRKIRERSETYIWVINEWQVRDPLLLSSNNLYSFDDLRITLDALKRYEAARQGK